MNGKQELPEWFALKTLAFQCKAHNDYRGALAHFEKALALAAKAHPLERARLYNQMADIYVRLDRHKQAEIAARSSIELELEFGDCGRETTDLTDFYIMLARALEGQGRFLEAAEEAKRALNACKDLFLPDDSFLEHKRAYIQSLEEKGWRG